MRVRKDMSESKSPAYVYNLLSLLKRDNSNSPGPHAFFHFISSRDAAKTSNIAE